MERHFVEKGRDHYTQTKHRVLRIAIAFAALRELKLRLRTE